MGLEFAPPGAKLQNLGVDRKSTRLNSSHGSISYAVFCLKTYVWPMIPITVNFFVKQCESKHGSPTTLAVAYCLAIIVFFKEIGPAGTPPLSSTGASPL